MALAEAFIRLGDGTLVHSTEDFYLDDNETIYSLSSLYANYYVEGMSVNDVRDKVEDALMQEFPELQ